MPVETRIQHRRDTEANWAATNPVLSAGELGVETDTLRFKVGSGNTAWNVLLYAAAGQATTAVTATNIAGGLAGSLAYQSGAGTTVLLPAGGNGQVLILAAGVPSWTQPKLNAFAATTSAELATVVADETGTGALVFATSPALVTPGIGSGGAVFQGSTSGTTTLRAAAAAGGTLTLPNETGTVATQTYVNDTALLRTGAQPMTGNLALGNNNISGVSTLTATDVTATSVLTTANLRVALSGYLVGTAAGNNVTASATIPSSVLTGRAAADFGAGSVNNWGNHSTNTRIWIQNTEPTVAANGVVEGDLYFWG
jgi:hypothetical protein